MSFLIYRTRLKYARFTRGVNTRFTRAAVEYLIQMSPIEALYSLLAQLLLGQRQKKPYIFIAGVVKLL